MEILVVRAFGNRKKNRNKKNDKNEKNKKGKNKESDFILLIQNLGRKPFEKKKKKVKKEK